MIIGLFLVKIKNSEKYVNHNFNLSELNVNSIYSSIQKQTVCPYFGPSVRPSVGKFSQLTLSMVVVGWRMWPACAKCRVSNTSHSHLKTVSQWLTCFLINIIPNSLTMKFNSSKNFIIFWFFEANVKASSYFSIFGGLLLDLNKAAENELIILSWQNLKWFSSPFSEYIQFNPVYVLQNSD